MIKLSKKKIIKNLGLNVFFNISFCSSKDCNVVPLSSLPLTYLLPHPSDSIIVLCTRSVPQCLSLTAPPYPSRAALVSPLASGIVVVCLPASSSSATVCNSYNSLPISTNSAIPPSPLAIANPQGSRLHPVSFALASLP